MTGTVSILLFFVFFCRFFAKNVMPCLSSSAQRDVLMTLGEIGVDCEY